MSYTIGLLLANLVLLTLGSPLIPRDSEDSPLSPNLDDNKFYEPSKNASEYRLSGTTVPVEYTINLIVDPNETTFDGNVTIYIKPIQATKEIMLHASSLITMIGHSVQEPGIGELESVMTRPNDDKEFLILTMAEDLVVDRIYRVNFVYTARFGSLSGLYKSTYRDENNTLVNLAVTHFQATSARKAFPCYDEPALKAIFSVNIYAPPNFNAISNMDVIEPAHPQIPDKRLTSFRPTPLMSSYLVAFLISDFKYASNTEQGQIIYPREFRIYGRPGTEDAMPFGLDFGQRSVQYLQGYTDVSYRLPKLDNAAIPDFGPGAMENWGLITYRESALLRFKGITTQSESSIVTTMTHEIAHFWFGDEVSPLWWDCLWLSEGFATYFQWYATDKVYDGEWRLMEQFVANDLQGIMNSDATPSINPMTNAVGSPAEISRNFNFVAYQKSGSVIRMIQHAIGEPLFRLALSNYLKSLPTGAAEPKMLFDELQKVVESTSILPNGITMNDVFGSWANQAGFPIIYANRNPQNEIKVKQERFFYNSNLTSNASWWVPLTFTSSSNPSFDKTTAEEWLKPGNTEMSIPIAPGEEWYVFNLQQSGYYRVMYDEENWIGLSKQLDDNHTIFHPLNKAQLIDDSSTFSMTGRLNYNRTLDVLAYLRFDDDWIPWISGYRAINSINTLMPASSLYQKYHYFLLSISSKVYRSVSFDVGKDDGYVTKRKRILALNTACRADSLDCMSSARQLLEDYLTNSVQVHPDLKSIVYCNGLKTDTSLWNATYYRFAAEASETEKNMLLQALGCSQDYDTIDKYLRMTIRNDSLIRVQDRTNVVQSVITARPDGITRTIVFLQQEFLNLRNSLPTASNMHTIIQTLGSFIVREGDIEAFQSFTDEYNSQFTTGERNALTIAWNSIAANQYWIENNMETIDAWLSEFYFFSTSSTTKASIFLTFFAIIYNIINM